MEMCTTAAHARLGSALHRDVSTREITRDSGNSIMHRAGAFPMPVNYIR